MVHPRDGWEAFQDFAASSGRRPWRSLWPSWAEPVSALLVQLLHVVSLVPR